MKPNFTLSLILAGATALLAACGGGGNNASIGGTVSGLNTGQTVVLQDNGTDSLTVPASGPFSFPTTLADGASYSVSILTQPAGQICEVADGSGQVDQGGDSITSVAIACVTTSSVGGTVSGLAAGTAVTLSNGSLLLPVATSGPFAFPGALVAGTPYEIAVATQPVGLTCTVTNGSGSVSAGSESAVTVTCT
jgi:hypothetical protein